MELQKAILTRRSIRRYTAEPVSRAELCRVIELARFAPSWKNTQTTRYTLVTDRALLDRIAAEGMAGFAKNAETLSNAPALVVLSTVTGRSGYERDGSPTTPKGSHWQSFDAGIAAQTFCLAAWEQSLGTLIMGIFDEEKVAGLIDLPAGESVSALIVVGRAAEEPTAPGRKETDALLRVID